MSGKSKIQAKIDELNQLLDWFDGDEFLIEEAMEKFKQADKLAKEIETELKSFKNEIKVVGQDARN